MKTPTDPNIVARIRLLRRLVYIQNALLFVAAVGLSNAVLWALWGIIQLRGTGHNYGGGYRYRGRGRHSPEAFLLLLALSPVYAIGVSIKCQKHIAKLNSIIADNMVTEEEMTEVTKELDALRHISVMSYGYGQIGLLLVVIGATAVIAYLEYWYTPNANAA